MITYDYISACAECKREVTQVHWQKSYVSFAWDHTFQTRLPDCHGAAQSPSSELSMQFGDTISMSSFVSLFILSGSFSYGVNCYS